MVCRRATWLTRSHRKRVLEVLKSPRRVAKSVAVIAESMLGDVEVTVIAVRYAWMHQLIKYCSYINVGVRNDWNLYG